MLRNVTRPGAYHGPTDASGRTGGRGPYFEGWYFKQVTADLLLLFFLLPVMAST